MAKQPAAASRVWFDHWRMDGLINSTALAITQETIPVGALSDVGPRRLVGNYDHTTSHMAFFDGLDDAQDEFLYAALQDGDIDHYMLQNFTQGVLGDPAYLSIVRFTAQPRTAAIGAAQMIGMELAGSNSMSRGLILGNKTTVGAENLTGQNQGATVAGVRYGFYWAITAWNGTNITLALQESQNDGAPDAYAAIAGLTSGAQTGLAHGFASTTAATEAWKRLAITGVYTSVTIVAFGGVMAGTG